MKYLLSIALLLLIACKKEAETPTELIVASTNFPVKFCIDSISGKSIKNTYLIPPDEDPAYWTPKADDILQLNQAKRVFLNGAGYEKWLQFTTLTNSFDSSNSFADKFIREKGQAHSHNGVSHTHDELDFNTWLDFDLLKIQATEISKELSKLSPASAEKFNTNLNSLTAKLDELKKELTTSYGEQKKFLASHPVYNYLARSQNWQLENFHWEPSEMPSPEEWEKLSKALSFSKYMLWENTPSKEISEKLQQLGVTIIVFRPCGNTPPENDFFAVMKSNIENLRNGLKK